MIRLLSSILDSIFAVILIWSVLRSLRGLLGGAHRSFRSRTAADHRGGGPASIGGDTVRDPVCGTFVSTEVSHRLKEDGKTLHFCSEECREAYLKSAAKV